MGEARQTLPFLLSFFFLFLCGVSGSARAAGPTTPSHYHPKLRTSPTLEPFLQQVAPGHDAFPEEKDAEEIAARLDDLSTLLRQGHGRARVAADGLLAAEFKGGRLSPAEGSSKGGGSSFEVVRALSMPTDLVLDRTTFGDELGGLVADLDAVSVAELLITAIEVTPGPPRLARTDVRYDVVGSGPKAWRAERVGRWRINWRRNDDGRWLVLDWIATDDVRSHATSPVFTEVTEAALRANPSFHQQLSVPLDAWLATIDSVYMRDSMGHHGVAAGDADGDGQDDIFVSQPAALPDRLFRNRGNGTFEDVTEAAGLAILDETADARFADIDNDGDQDLVLVASGGLLLFDNDGKGHFTRVKDAFRFKALRGSPMSIALADYDGDGFLDVYLCTYSYFIGASEDKAGTPIPYYDAQNGPPNVLLRNDGHGHFVDVTDDAGLGENNNRYSFAAAWGDYDEDGWPDLLIANDFGRKNLYHNEGRRNGKVTFRDVTAKAGVLDHGAGMSAAWVDYDNDGHLDIYTGNMWSANGQRITAEPGFMPEAPAEIRALYRRHARGNSLFRNRGDGTFEDVTLAARANFGRWAWSSDAVDFDRDGWEDLYVVNGMFTRESGPEDLDGFFWRQVAARSPLTKVTGTPYEDAWRAVNRLLGTRSRANHQRNVFLRNDGQGGFDEVSGAVGLDLDQDGRAFAVVDYDLDGDPDLVVMAARSSPQLRIFRNDFGGKGASLALRLVGTRSNRDAVGARVTVETDRMHRTKVVQAGSGFISQHSKELLFGLGESRRIMKVTIRWPSGLTQTFADLPLNQRVRIEEGGTPTAEPFRTASALPLVAASEPARLDGTRWLYEPFPVPLVSVRDLTGREHALGVASGRPSLVLFWSTSAAASRTALLGLARDRAALAAAGVDVLAISLDSTEETAKVREAAPKTGVPVAVGGDAVGTAYSVLNRYLFVGKEDLRLPSALLLNARGEAVKVYRDAIDVAQIVADVPKIEAAPAERIARSVPFPGVLDTPPGERNYLQYALELVEQGLDASALSAFERAAKGDPSAFTLYSLGTLYMKTGQPAKAQASFERALQVQSDFTEANNGLGALLAQGGDVTGAITQFRTALQATPDYPDAMNNLGYALLQTGQEQEALGLFHKALALQPSFPEAFNNLGIYFARSGDMAQAEANFKQAVEARPTYGEAGNNLALVLMAKDDPATAIGVLQRLMEASPDFEMTYVTLAKIYASTGKSREALQVLERLLQKNPQQPQALEMVRDLRAAQ